MNATKWGDFTIEVASAKHLHALQALIFDHGANVWNYLPDVGIREHIDDIAQGRAHGVLAMQALASLATMGVQMVFIDRHEENRASSGMMRRAGFVEVETYPDPRRRTHGSGRTTVCCFRFLD